MQIDNDELTQVVRALRTARIGIRALACACADIRYLEAERTGRSLTNAWRETDDYAAAIGAPFVVVVDRALATLGSE